MFMPKLDFLKKHVTMQESFMTRFAGSRCFLKLLRMQESFMTRLAGSRCFLKQLQSVANELQFLHLQLQLFDLRVPYIGDADW